MSGNRDVLILPNPPAGDVEAELTALNYRLDDLAGKEKALSNLVSLYDQKDALAPLNATEKEARKKYLGELQRVKDETAQLEKDRAELASQQAASSGTSRHIANETAPWKAVCIEPDFCEVGDEVVPFDSFATINLKAKASPNVRAQGVPVYRVGDMHHGVQADAGAHVTAGTSLGSGYVKFTEGQSNVFANGIPVVRHDNECIVNCNAAGEGGAKGKVVTDQVAVQSSATFVEQADALSKKLHVEQGAVKNAYDLATREMSNPNNSLFDRGVYLLGATATLPVAMLEELGRGIMNIPSAVAGAVPQASQGGENIGVALDSSLPGEERVIGALKAVENFASAFLGLGAVAGGIKPTVRKPAGSKPPVQSTPPPIEPPPAPATSTAGVRVSPRGTGAFLEGAEGGTGFGKLTDRSVNVSEKGLDIVEGHLKQFGDLPENQMMIDRLRNAMTEGTKVSGADASFYMHELAEATRMRAGIGYDAAHAASLSKYQVSPYSVYHPDVIKSLNQEMPGYFNSNWSRFWGISK